jgi:hypothetical protein
MREHQKRDKRRAAAHGTAPEPVPTTPLQDVSNSPRHYMLVARDTNGALINHMDPPHPPLQSPRAGPSTTGRPHSRSRSRSRPVSRLISRTGSRQVSRMLSRQVSRPISHADLRAPSHAPSPRGLTYSPTHSNHASRASPVQSPRLPSRASTESLPEYPIPRNFPHHDDLTNEYFNDLRGNRVENAFNAHPPRPFGNLIHDQHFSSEEDDDEDFGLPREDEEGDHFNVINENPLPDYPESEPGSEPEDEPMLAGIPAFDEPPAIRNIYIHAWVQKTNHHATHRSIKHYLSTFDELLLGHPAIEPIDIAQMARSISTVEQRLGLSTSDLIVTFTLCPKCHRRYSPAYIAAAAIATCLTEECEGELFTEKLLASGERKRMPALTYPYASIKGWLRRMLSRDGYPELMQAWRTPTDHGAARPTSCRQWYDQLDLDQPLGDIFDGWGWRSRRAALERVYNADTGEVGDRSQVRPEISFASLPYGISLSMNVDW